jgi:hypothetical protein
MHAMRRDEVPVGAEREEAVHKHWKGQMAGALAVMAAVIFTPFGPAQITRAATCSPTLESVTLAPASVPGGASSTVTANLNCATSASVTVSLKAFSGVTVPARLTVTAGHASGSATVTTATTKTARQGWIVGTLGKVSHERLLTVTATPATCATPSLTVMLVSGGGISYVGEHPVVWIAVSCAVGAAVHVSMKSTSAYLPVPATATISKYYDSVSVPLTPKAYAPGQYQATISVHYGGKTLSSPVTIYPGLSAVWATSSNNGYDSVDLAIKLTGKGPLGLRIGSPNQMLPLNFTVPAGAAVGHLIAKLGDVSAPRTVTLSATLHDRTLSTTVTIQPAVFGSRGSILLDDGTTTLSVSGGDSESVRVELSVPAPAGGVVVTLTAGDPALRVDSPVTIDAGDRWAFPSLDVGNVTEPVHTTLTAAADGVTAIRQVTVEPGVVSITGVPKTLAGGDGFTATANLAGPPDEDVSFPVYVIGTLVLSPSVTYVTIPAGQTSAGFAMTSVPVTSKTYVYLEATTGWHSVVSSGVDVLPPAS